MNSPNKKDDRNISEFFQSAAALDADFAELERLGGQLDRLEIDSDNGLEQAQKRLARFSECGERIGTGIMALAKALDETRARAEKLAEVVRARAVVVQERQNETQRLLMRFQSLGELAKKINATIAGLKKPVKKGELTDDEKALLSQHMPEIDSKLGMLLDEARKLREDARKVNMKALERNAETLSQALLSARRQLGTAIQSLQ